MCVPNFNFLHDIYFQNDPLKVSIGLEGSPFLYESMLRTNNKDWLKMVGVDKRGLSSSKGVGSEEDNEVNRSCNYANKVWGWKIEVGMVGEKGLLTKGSKL